MLMKRISFAAGIAFALATAPASAAPVTVGGPIADPLDIEGTGLCMASSISTEPPTDFPQSTAAYASGINTFMEEHIQERVEATVRSFLDLSNNNTTAPAGSVPKSYGDFVDANVPVCKSGGCDFPWSDNTETSFASRLRGYLNVTADMAGKPFHVGLFADDAASLTFFGKNGAIYPVIIRPPQLGAATWRVTNTVTFDKAGLYPVEILYASIVEHAAFEMSLFDGTFTDIEQKSTEPGATSLKDSGFTLFPHTRFFQTLSGEHPFADPNACKQCDRQFVNLPGNNGCVPGYYCNEAAVCAPCDSALLCGPSCAPCGGDTPFCINVNGQNECGGCRTDYDCKEGFSCDPIKHVCNECEENDDCPRGEICTDHSCVPCELNEACAGNSCNCCPAGSNGKPMTCSHLDANGAAVCIECETNADCTEGRLCDGLTGHCVDEIKMHATPDCCGENCATCPSDFPFCLPGPIGTACAECRSDMDCGDGKFCLSGQCVSCIRDRRCGMRCESCGGDTPYCLGQIPDKAVCARCVNDSQCAVGTCNPLTHECDPGCQATCDPSTPYCDGQKCVECYADTQCSCGGTCNLETNTCTSSCKSNVDCLGNEHCRWTVETEDDEDVKECALGPMPGDVACGGTLESCAIGLGRKDENPPTLALLALSMLALLGRRCARGRS